MTKKIFLAWRLPQLPTGSDVASLVEQKVLSAKEARDMLFEKREQAAYGGPVPYTYTSSNGTSITSFTMSQPKDSKNSEKSS